MLKLRKNHFKKLRKIPTKFWALHQFELLNFYFYKINLKFLTQLSIFPHYLDALIPYEIKINFLPSAYRSYAHKIIQHLQNFEDSTKFELFYANYYLDAMHNMEINFIPALMLKSTAKNNKNDNLSPSQILILWHLDDANIYY